ncbi:hypothetical protein ACFE04_002886 [Oxalis oulophora]
MAKKPENACIFLIITISLFLFIHTSNQLQQSQSQTLRKIGNLFNFTQLQTASDLCNIEPNPSLTISCYEDNITQLHITGFPNDYLSTLTLLSTSIFTLRSLKVLSLVSLGLTGSLPTEISQLSSLEILNVSSNYLNGSIPVELSSIRTLQTLILDDNRFAGRIPVWLGLLQELAVLSLKNNSFTGFLPKSLANLGNLRILALSSNNLSGELPDLRGLKHLQVLDLGDNKFGPHFPNFCNKLVTLLLRNNRFTLGIPEGLDSYIQLREFDISNNGVVGPFSPTILSLPSITYVNVAGNKLTGLLYENTSCSVGLAFIDISSNLLTGDLPTCLRRISKNRVALYSKNCLSTKKQEQHLSSFCDNQALAVKIIPHDNKQKRANPKTVVASTMVGGIFGGVAVVGLAVFLVKKVYSKDGIKSTPTRLITENVSMKMLSDAGYISQTMKLGASLPVYRAYALEEIKEATKNFDASTLIAVGSHGEVYKGKFADGMVAAIKSLEMKKRCSVYTYTHHIELISKLRHANLSSALGHCFEYYQDDTTIRRIFLIFEFVSNGTLRDHVSGRPDQKLTWTQRISAAIGVAKAIQFLHTGIHPGVVSNKLKITDVLLDHNLSVKISSCNLPLLAENKERVGALLSSSGLKESFQARAKHGDENDIYNIGVILLETIMGRPIMSQNEVIVNKDLLGKSVNEDEEDRRNLVDPAVVNECSDESLQTMMKICLRCLSNSDEPTYQPSVEDVLWNLQFAAQVQDQWIGDYLDNQDDDHGLCPDDQGNLVFYPEEM